MYTLEIKGSGFESPAGCVQKYQEKFSFHAASVYQEIMTTR